MNLVYILGNGFDKVFNLPTLYSEFYKYYLAQAPENEHVEKMKKHLEKHMYDTWADMEMGLGKYTSEISSYEELEADYHSLTMNIQAYLREVSNDFLPSTETASKFMIQFVRPWSFLLPGQLREVASFVTNVSGSHVIDVISLNYTYTLEKLFRTHNERFTLPYHYTSSETIRTVRHIHQSLDDDEVILGVNDISQIDNAAFHDNVSQNLLVKPVINSQLRTLIDEECLSIIGSADLFCVFGASIGETDSMWWKAIGDSLKRGKSRLIYYAFDKQVITYNNQKIGKLEQYTSLILKRCGLESASNLADIRKRIYIGYKTKLFVLK